MIIRLTNILFLLLIFSLGFTQPYFVYHTYKIPGTDFLFPLVFLFWILALLTKQTKLKLSWFYLPMGLFFFSLTISTIFSEDPARSVVKYLGEVYLIGLAILGFNLINSIRDFKRVCYVWLAATFTVGVVTLATVILFYIDRQNWLLNYTLSVYGSLPAGNYPRIHSTFYNANLLCDYLNVGIMFILAAYQLNWINQLVFIILLIFFSLALFFTLSPGAGGIVLAVGIWYWLVWKSSGNPALAKLSLTAGVFGAILLFLSVLPSISSFKQLAPSSRVLLWHSALQTLLSNPIVGRGVGLDAANVVYVDGSGGTQQLLDAHQMWLNISAQQGFIGLAAICLICLFFLHRILRFKFENTPISILQIALGLAFIGTVLYQGLTGSFEHARYLWVLIALLGVISDDTFSKNISYEND